MSLRVLVVDDDPGVRYTIREILESEGLGVDEAADGEEALRRLDAGAHALVITDLRMPRLDGMALLRAIGARSPAPRVVLVTAHGSERQAVEAMKAGAFDYFRKPFEPEELLAVVRRAAESVRLAQENERLAGALALAGGMILESEAMRRLAALVARVAPRDVTVLVSGESGTGKERIADAIVRASRRADRPFVRFNCAALTPELAEAELFGHARGAFTGAVSARKGLFEEADGGTLFLDEIGEMSMQAQVRLLRVLQDGEFERLGSPKTIKVNVRLITATNRDLNHYVRESRFREDLFYRLNIFPLFVPPLRERKEDILPLVWSFVQEFGTRMGKRIESIPRNGIETLQNYGWPGNVRELRNVIERAMIMTTGPVLRIEIPKSIEAKNGRPGTLEEIESRHIIDVLNSTGWRVSGKGGAAEILDLNPKTLESRMKKLGIQRKK